MMEADKAPWRYVQEHCPEGTRAKPGAETTEFEKHWLVGMRDPRVRAHLQFLQGSASSPAAASSGLGGGGRPAALLVTVPGTGRTIRSPN